MTERTIKKLQQAFSVAIIAYHYFSKNPKLVTQAVN